MKKFLSIILATLLAVSVFTGCAKQTSLPEKDNVLAQGNELASKQTATPTSGGVPTNTSAAYAKLIAYKTEGYGQQSVADFNMALAPTLDELKLIHRECGHTPEKRPNSAPAGPCPFCLLG